MAKGMRVVVRTVLLSSATKPTMAARVIQVPSHGRPINDPPMAAAASEKYPVFHFSQLPAEAKPASVGRKYAAIESGTTTASARGYDRCGFSTSSATVESCSYPEYSHNPKASPTPKTLNVA